MFNPSMFENARQNMTWDQSKMAAEMLSKMSDEELRNYAKITGTNILLIQQVEMMRQSANMMKNMDEAQFKNFKNMVERKQTYNEQSSGINPNIFQNTPQPASNSTSLQHSSITYKKIENLKNQGNENFKRQKYDEASTNYLEVQNIYLLKDQAIIEIEDIRAQNKSLVDNELDILEISCRTNYATVKSKLGDYESVITHASAALKIQDNGKAHFRLGEAFHHFGKQDKALEHLEKAKNILNDESVKELYAKVKSLNEKNAQSSNEESKSRKMSDKDEEIQKDGDGNKRNAEIKHSLKKKNAPGVDNSFINDGKKKYEPEPSIYKSSNDTRDEFKIEEEKYQPETTPQTQTVGSNFNPKINPEEIHKGREQLKNMSPEQLNMMTNTFKNMDNGFIRQMMKNQMGVEMSDSEIERMKQQMSPDLLSNISKMDPSFIPTVSNPSTNISSQTLQGSPNTLSNSLPDMNPDMIKTTLGMLEQNPEMLKSIGSMLGESHPITKFIANKSPEDLKGYIKVIKKLAGVFLFFSPVLRILKRYWQLIFGLLIGYVLYKLLGQFQAFNMMQ